MRLTLFFAFLLSILAVFFAIINTGEFTTVHLWPGSPPVEGPTSLILIVTLALGFIVGVLSAVPGWIRNRRKVSSLQKTIADREDQVRRERETTRTETKTRDTPTPPPETRTPPPSDTSSSTETPPPESSSSSDPSSSSKSST